MTLYNLQDFLRNNLVLKNKKNRDIIDARTESLLQEADVIRAINTYTSTSCITPPPRYWYDIAIVDKVKTNVIYYINIKISSGGCDNAFNKKAIAYSLSNIAENDINNTMSYNQLWDIVMSPKTSRKKRNRNAEYYFLYIDKLDKTVFIRSLCDIRSWVSNPTNILQINWAKEKKEEEKEKEKEKEKEIDNIRHTIMDNISTSLRKFYASCSSFIIGSEIESV
jgi:hypothetical protein